MMHFLILKPVNIGYLCFLFILISCENEVELETTPGKNLVADELIDTDLVSEEIQKFNSQIDLDKICSEVTIKINSETSITGKRDCSSNDSVFCSAGGQTNCKVSDLDADLVVVDKSKILASMIVKDFTIAGITGSQNPALIDCSADGQSDCVVSGVYKAAKTTNLAGKILSGNTVAGVDGTYVPDFPSANNVKSIDTVDGVSGNLADCSYDGEINCTTSLSFKSVNMANATAGNIKTGVTIGGVNGTYGGGALSDCATDGEIGCKAVTAFRAVDMTKVISENIKFGITMASIAGGYPSATYPLAGSSATSDLISSGFNSALTSATAFEYWTSAGVRHTGAGDVDLIASNIKNSISLFGVTGSVTESPTNCSSDAETGCVAVSAFKAADMTNVTVGNIKSGSTIAGVTGDYPSSSYPLTGASATSDLDAATFNAKMKSSTVFEYWNSAGDKQSGSGDDDISTANLKTDVNVFGTVGTFAGPGSLATPTGFSAVDKGSSQIDLSWDDMSVTGYLLIVNQGGVVTFTPVDGTGYSTGVQAGGDIVYTGSTNSFSQTTGLTTGNVYHYALYSYDSDNNFSSVATIIEYARYNCGGSGDNCYDDASAKLLGFGITPLGKNLDYVFANGADGFKVWKESEGDRILRANGLDEWAIKLNIGGKSFSSNNFTDPDLGSIYTLLGGRACPDNVYIDDSNKFTTDNCVYYTQSYQKQALDKDGYSQVSAFGMGLSSWTNYNSGNAKWYAGNIKTCSDKGMRLPTLYETNTTRVAYTYYPNNDGSPVFNITNAIPLSESIWTSSTYSSSSNPTIYWHSNSGDSSASAFGGEYLIICILP